MKKKCVFFDADGTILDIEKGVPEETKLAIKNLIHNGHRVFLCTGRSRAYILIIPGLFEPPIRTLRATIPENESHIFR